MSLTQRNVNVHCFLFRVYEDGFFTRPVMCHNIVKAVPLGSVLKPFIFVKEVGFLPKDVQSNTTRAEVLTRPRPPPSLQIAFVILRLSASWWAGAILRWKCELWWMRNENGVSQTALLRDDEKTAVIILITKFVYSMNFWTEGVAGFDEAAVPLKAKWVELSSCRMAGAPHRDLSPRPMTPTWHRYCLGFQIMRKIFNISPFHLVAIRWRPHVTEFIVFPTNTHNQLYECCISCNYNAMYQLKYSKVPRMRKRNHKSL